jgi:hypothetical protein
LLREISVSWWVSPQTCSKSARGLVSHGEDGRDGARRKHPGLLRDHVDLAGLGVVWGRYVGGAYSQLLNLLAEVLAFPTS